MVQSLHMDRSPSENQAPSRRSRPILVTLLAVGVLIIASLYLLRLVETVRQWQFLSSLDGVSPLYQALTGLIWASAGLPLFWGLWRGHARAASFAPGYLLAFGLYYWFDRLVIANRAVSLANWPVTAGLTVVSLAFMFLALRVRASRDYFKG
jgi:hypothetical protein